MFLSELFLNWATANRLQPNGSGERGKTMAIELRCSSCGARLYAGSGRCVACGTVIVASAQPSAHVQKARYSVWGVILVCIVAFVILAKILSRRDQSSTADAKAAFLADVAAGKLSTAEAFKARCGTPKDTKETKQGTELLYRAGSLVYFVTLTRTSPIFETESSYEVNGEFKSFRVNQEPANFFSALKCK
jgi:hypothetical protein